MADFEVHIDLDGRTRHVGLARSNRVRGTETVLFEYAPAWLTDPERFLLEPALALTGGTFAYGALLILLPNAWVGEVPPQGGGGVMSDTRMIEYASWSRQCRLNGRFD